MHSLKISLGISSGQLHGKAVCLFEYSLFHFQPTCVCGSLHPHALQGNRDSYWRTIFHFETEEVLALEWFDLHLIWKCIVCFTYTGLGLKSSRLPIQRRVRIKSLGAMDINPSNHRRKEIETKLSSTFHMEFYFFSAEYSLCAKINHRCTKMLTTWHLLNTSAASPVWLWMCHWLNLSYISICINFCFGLKLLSKWVSLNVNYSTLLTPVT